MTVIENWTGRRASDLQAALRMTNEAYAEHLGVAVRTVCKWRENPGLVQTSQMQSILDRALERADQGTNERFLMLLDPRQESVARSAFGLTSHKFVPVYVGPAEVARLGEGLGAESIQLEWTSCWAAPVAHPRGECVAYGLPWGVVLYHLTEVLERPTITSVAQWRRDSYRVELGWFGDELGRTIGGHDVRPEYVLSMYWVEAPIWAGAELDSALRLLCTPRVLIDEQAAEGEVAQPDLTERALIRDGFDDPRIVAFGLRGAAAGFASWSGVSYAPLVTRRALTASQLVRFEIVVQSLWCYCHHVRSQVETGADPVIPDEFGWRWLRAVRARLSGARPTESAQHASMRSAILETSELLRHLNGTMEVLRDSALEGNR